jgi:hypothetical protein
MTSENCHPSVPQASSITKDFRGWARIVQRSDRGKGKVVTDHEPQNRDEATNGKNLPVHKERNGEGATLRTRSKSNCCYEILDVVSETLK